MLTKSSVKLTLDGARLMLEAAEKKAMEIGVPMDIAITDEGGNLIAFHRMDGAKITSIDIAINKAFTAAGAKTPTADYMRLAEPGGGAFGIHVSNQGRFMVFPGGLPIMVEGQIIGGIGVSSGTGEQDVQVAQAGIDALLTALGKK